jgi:general secretion pathway protein D
VAYKIVGKLAGINVLFDPEFKPQRLSVEVNDVTPREALDMVALQSRTFWQPVSTNTIMVAADTPGKRKDRQNNIMTTFYLKNVSTATDLQDAANTVKSILDLTRVQLIPRQNAIVMRGTADQLVLAQKLLTDIDKPQPECVIDIVVMQIRRDKVRTLGTNLPTSASVALVPGGGVGATGGGSFTINSLRNINATNFQVSIPGATLTALMDDSNTKIIQNPEIRALDNQKATLKIGDRVPIATGSFSGGGGASVSPLVNTQFQYLDVGVNIDITPHIHANHEVTLQMTLEISSVTGSQNLGGVTQPIIGQRRIEHEMRLRDGDINLVGGILEDSETQSMSGYPGLLKVPILKYLFGQENKEVRENEIVFAITPHIVRGQDLDEQNLRPVDIGTGSVVEMRHPAPDVPANTTAKATPKGAPGTAPKATRTVGSNPTAPVPAPTAAPTTAPPPPQVTANTGPNRATTEAFKADGPTDSCPKGATPEHPIGCYLNGTWRVDVGDGRGYQTPPGTTGPAALTTPSAGPAKGATGAVDHPDPKAAQAAPGPLV